MINLKTAKYKGVEFLFDDMPTTGGNRLIKFNYPGSDKQSIERQGKAPRSFSITIIIPHDNYYAQRDNILRVLEDGEKGVLVHPTFGDIENVINGIYDLDEKITELGRATISVTFEIDDGDGVPVQSSELISITEQLNSDFQETIDFDLGDVFGVSLKFPNNFTDAVAQLGDVSELMATVTTITSPLIEEGTEFISQLKTFDTDLTNLVKSPLNLASSISSLYESITIMYETPSQTFVVLTAMFDFGDGDAVIKPTTAGRIERKKNRDILNTTIQSKSLSNAYLIAAEIEYNSTEDIDVVQNGLEAQYTKLRDSGALSNSAMEVMDILRVQAQKTIDLSRVNTRQIITIETKRTPLSALVYAYYGNTDLFEQIAELNNVSQNGFVEGEVKILTS